LDEPPEISQGFHSEKAAPLAGYSLPFDFQMEGVGYREALALKDEARALCIKIGVYVAMADGDLHEHEGQALQMWIKRMLEGSNSDTRDALKDRLNTALKDGYQEAKNGTLVLSELTERLAAIADVSMKYELVENCYDIAMRSGSNNTQVVDRIAKVLSLDLAEIEKIRDIKLVNQRRSDQPINIEELLGIDPSWDKATINRHLRNEFQKWNNRITSLAEGEEREMAQRMLNAISEARKNYG
jgi:tellurite resistance protein